MIAPLIQPPLAPLSAHGRFWALVPCAGMGLRAVAAGAAAPAARPRQAAPTAPPRGGVLGVGRLLGTLVAVAPGDRFLDTHAHPTFFVVECGGPTRADTVLGGLKALLERGAQPDDWVLVHDAARCLVTSEQIDSLIDQCAGDSVGGLLAHKLADTLKTSIDGPGGVRVASTVDRSDKWLAQTPQMFRIGPLMDAIDKVGTNVTDEASAME